MSIDREAAEQRPREQIRRQAIVLVHGMGEQIPMETVRDFATGGGASDRGLHSDQEKKGGRAFLRPGLDDGVAGTEANFNAQEQAETRRRR